MPEPAGSGSNGVLLVGEALGEDEAREGKPFVGKAGFQLTSMLQRLGLNREDFLIDNCLRCRPPMNALAGTAYETQVLGSCKHHLAETIRQHQPKCVVALGATATKVLLPEPFDRASLENRRGYVEWSPEFEVWVIPTFHPSFLMRGNQKLTGVWMNDIQHALHIAKHGHIPAKILTLEDPTPMEFQHWVDDYAAALANNPETVLSYDIETLGKQSKDEDEVELSDPSYEITRIGFSYRPDEAVSIPWAAEFMPAVRQLMGSAGTKLGWNTSYDRPRVESKGVVINGPQHDGMWAWHVANSDLRKGLGFVATFYAWDQPRWKHLGHVNQAFYNGCDAAVTLKIYLGIHEDLQELNLWDIYLRHVCELDQEVLWKMSAAGVLLHDGHRREASDLLTVQLDEISNEIEAVVPTEARQVKIYKQKKAADRALVENPLATLLELPSKRKAKVCTACGEVDVTKPHVNRKTIKNETLPLLEGVQGPKENIKLPNPCFGAGIETTTVDTIAYGVTQAFTPSNTQMMAYQRALKHKPVLSQEKRPTFDDDALKKLQKTYTNDPLYPLVLRYRAVEKILSGYIGNWDEGQQQWQGGLGVGVDGRVHTTYCLSGDHEVLTPKGWVRLDLLSPNASIAQWQLYDSSLHFEQINCLHQFSGQHAGIRLQSSRIDQLVTRNHTLPYDYLASGGRVYTKTCAAEHLPVNALLPLTGYLQGNPHSNLTTLRLAAAIQADGHIEGERVRFNFAKTRKVARLKWLLGEAGIVYRERHKRWHCIDIASRDLSAALAYLGDNKTFCIERLLALDATVLREWLDELLKWDGTRLSAALLYGSTNKANAETVQTIAHVCGVTASLTHRPKTETRKDYYTVVFAKGDRRSAVKTKQACSIDTVYCPETSTGFFLVRRNGKISVTGNTHNPSTLRLSSQNPNVQVWPRGATPEAKLVKRLVVAKPGYRLCESDFSAIEAVLVGYFAGSANYIRLAKLGIHDYVLSHMLHRAGTINAPADLTLSDADLRAFYADLKKRYNGVRDVAKRVVHMSNYGGTPQRMNQANPESFPTVKAARELQAMYFDICPEVKVWQEHTVAMADKHGYLRNPFGYLHRFWQVRGWKRDPDGRWVASWGEDAKRALAFLPQSTASGLLKEALLRLRHTAVAPYLRLQVHDSLLCEIPEDEVDEICRLLQEELEKPSAYLPLDPAWGMGDYLSIGTETKTGPNWGEMEIWHG